MTTVYCDQNVLIAVVKHEGVPPRGDFGRLLESGRVQFVFSVWHVVETAGARDSNLVDDLGRLMAHAAAYWLPDKVPLQLAEIQQAAGMGGAPEALRRTFSEVVRDLNPGLPAYVLADPVEFVQQWHRRPQLFVTLREAHRQNRAAFRRNVRAVKAGKLSLAKDAEIIQKVAKIIAERHGQNIQDMALQGLRPEQLPTLHTEAVLSRLQWGHGGGLRWQKFMDNQHQIVALPHVEVCVTFDVRQRRFAQKLCGRCSSSRARVVGSLAEAAE